MSVLYLIILCLMAFVYLLIYYIVNYTFVILHGICIICQFYYIGYGPHVHIRKESSSTASCTNVP